jgi:cardiolipin synthase
VLTIPNLISVIRLGLVPVFLWLLLGRDNPFAAGWLFGFIAATDWVDGYLARRLDQVSEVGKFLDPLADRVAVVAALVGGLISGYLPAWFAWAVVAREVLIGGGAIIVGFLGHTKLEVRQMGKLATFLVYSSLAWFLVGTEWDWVRAAAWIVGLPGLILYYAVGFQYFSDALAAIRRSRASAEPQQR